MKSFYQITALMLFLIQLVACNQSNREVTQKDEDSKEEATIELKATLIDNDSIHYMDVGEGETVIFVHGGVGDYRVWRNQIEEFKENYRVVTYSRRFAYPNKQVYVDTADYTVSTHARDLIELITKLSPNEPVHLVGHSYGAYTSLWVTINRPDLVRTLTLGEPPVMSLLEHVPNGNDQMNEFFMNVFMPSIEAFKAGKDEAGVVLFVNGVIGDTSYYSNISALEKKILLDNKLELKGGLLSNKPDPQISCRDLENLAVPTLLIKGEKSPELFGSIIKVLDSCISNSKLVVLPKSSHGLEIENPKDFNKKVLAFISDTNK